MKLASENKPPENTKFQRQIVCPYCGCKASDSWEYGEESTEYECGHCEKTSVLEVHVSVEYSTTMVETVEANRSGFVTPDAALLAGTPIGESVGVTIAGSAVSVDVKPKVSLSVGGGPYIPCVALCAYGKDVDSCPISSTYPFAVCRSGIHCSGQEVYFPLTEVDSNV